MENKIGGLQVLGGGVLRYLLTDGDGTFTPHVWQATGDTVRSPRQITQLPTVYGAHV